MTLHNLIWLWFCKFWRAWLQRRFPFPLFKNADTSLCLKRLHSYCIIRPHFVSVAEICVAIEKEECWFKEILNLHRGPSRAKTKKKAFSTINIAHPQMSYGSIRWYALGHFKLFFFCQIFTLCTCICVYVHYKYSIFFKFVFIQSCVLLS